MKRLIFALAAVQMLLSGCTFETKYDYQSQTLDLPVSSGGSVAVAVSDQRPNVVYGGKSSKYVGLQRGGWGQPYDAETLSQEPLADVFAATIAAALERKGITVRPVKVAPSVNDKTAIQALAASGADKALLVSLREWRSDMTRSGTLPVAMMYDVKAQVFDVQGHLIGENAAVGHKILSLEGWNANTAVPAAYGLILEFLLGEPKILDALK